MANQLLLGILQSVWSSMTGGWFYNPHSSFFANTLHMYTWMLLFLLPLSFYLFLPNTLTTWAVYSSVVTVLFAVVKVLNYKFSFNLNESQKILSEYEDELEELVDKEPAHVTRPTPIGSNPTRSKAYPGIACESKASDIQTSVASRSNYESERSRKTEDVANAETHELASLIEEDKIGSRNTGKSSKSALLNSKSPSSKLSADEPLHAASHSTFLKHKAPGLEPRRFQSQIHINIKQILNDSTNIKSSAPEMYARSSERNLLRSKSQENFLSTNNDDYKEIDEIRVESALKTDSFKPSRSPDYHSSIKSLENSFKFHSSTYKISAASEDPKVVRLDDKSEKFYAKYNRYNQDYFILSNRLLKSNLSSNNDADSRRPYFKSKLTDRYGEFEKKSNFSTGALKSRSITNYRDDLLATDRFGNRRLTRMLGDKSNMLRGPKQKFFNLRFDHLALLSLLDSSQSLMEVIGSVVLAGLVAVACSYMLLAKVYGEACFLQILFCFVVASCHFSLLKSCQPDSASPIHGFNHIVALSRPIYFCLFCAVIVAANVSSTFLPRLSADDTDLSRLLLSVITSLAKFATFLKFSLLSFPVIFTLGFLPQINTFVLCVLEQVQIEIFGSTAIVDVDLFFAFLTVFKGFLAVLALATGLWSIRMASSNGVSNSESTRLGLATLVGPHDQDRLEIAVVFSCYCALLVCLAYVSSRHSSDVKANARAFGELAFEFFSGIRSKISNAISSDMEIRCQIWKKSSPPSAAESIPMEPMRPTTPAEDEAAARKDASSKPQLRCETEMTKSTVSRLDVQDSADTIDAAIKDVVKRRMESELFVSVLMFCFLFALHVSRFFYVLGPYLHHALCVFTFLIGFFNHNLMTNLRRENPFGLLKHPLLKSKHWSVFEPKAASQLAWFERAFALVNLLEGNVLSVLIVLNALTMSFSSLVRRIQSLNAVLADQTFLPFLVITCFAFKLLQSAYNEPSKLYKIVIFSYLFNMVDFLALAGYSTEQRSSQDLYLFLPVLFLASILLNKLDGFLDKIKFIFIYTAPWQLPWASALHALAQPLSIAHSGLVLFQAVVSSLINAPLMPFMGSAIFIISYIRPVKFWERSYRPKKSDPRRSRLQLSVDLKNTDSENLNSIFYEHLTYVLQTTLCGDLTLGRWGKVVAGDFFILSSDYLNCLVHVIELGNGFVTFQLRGLEFKGTYCQQRELEAITEDNLANSERNFCCFSVRNSDRFLSLNSAFNLVWQTWSVSSRSYILDSYRIIENDFGLIINFFTLRQTLVSFYVKSVLYFLAKSAKLDEWLIKPEFCAEMAKIDADFVDTDSIFDPNLDLDYDKAKKGVTFAEFNKNYNEWIRLSLAKRPPKTDDAISSNESEEKRLSAVSKLAFILSLVCRRLLLNSFPKAAESSNLIDHHEYHEISEARNEIDLRYISSINPELCRFASFKKSNFETDSLTNFQKAYFTLFKGDIRIKSSKDDWIMSEPDLVRKVIVPGVRMGLRLHQNHFQIEFSDNAAVLENLVRFESETVISYERDPCWRQSILSNVPSLLALRHQFSDYSDQYKTIMLNKSYLSFRVIKLNKECVRSLWAGQQNELIFLRNKNQERGSIQSAKQVLRNIINSSCDQPLGYPIYVSKLVTSYSSTHNDLRKILGYGEMSFGSLFESLKNCFTG